MKQYIRIALIATILSLVLIYVTAAKKSNNKRVSGGTGFDYDNQFPHLVSLQYSRDGRKYQHFCGGSIISSNWVVTAGHCLAEDGMDISKMRILAGVVKQDIDCSQASSNCVIRTVKRKIVHPNYNSQYIRNDIALLELSSALPLGAASQNKVQSIGIEGGTIPFRTVVTLTGWGRTLDSSNDLPSLAQKAFLPLQQPDVCNRQGLGMEGPYQLCAGEGRGINSCQGDSGGPLHWIRQNGNVNTMGLIGLVSYGPQGCGKQNAFGVYTNTTYWINYVKNYVPDLKVVNYMSADGGNTPTPTPTPTPNPSPCTCAQTVTTTETQTQSTVNEPSNREPSMEQRHIELPKVISIEKKQ